MCALDSISVYLCVHDREKESDISANIVLYSAIVFPLAIHCRCPVVPVVRSASEIMTE